MYVGSKFNVRKINDDIPVMVNSEPISRVYSIYCLGVIKTMMSGDEHINCNESGTGTLFPANTRQTIYSDLI